MCGRFVSASPPDEIARYFAATAPDVVLEPNYNVAPTDDVYAVRADGGVRRLDAFHWGLVPWWADDPKIGAKMINARSETLRTRGTHRDAFRRRRCLVPADGFYEWRKLADGKRKQPYYVERRDGEPLALAGLWASWRRRAPATGPGGVDDRGGEVDPGDRLRSCTILTTTPNETVAELHDRMPVILPASAWDAWLDPDHDDLDALGRLLVPAPASLVTIRPVPTLVNSVRNNGPELIGPGAEEATLDLGV
jgi:putative SOS response-associated peptidase YedK